MPDMVDTSSWQKQSTSGQTLYINRFNGYGQPALKQALEASAAKSIELLDENIREDSLYLLFEWSPAAAELNIVVTDVHKQQDGAYKVQATLPDLHTSLSAVSADQHNAHIETLNNTIKFLLSDFLASYSPFFRYSLVAIFHSSSRAETNLL